MYKSMLLIVVCILLFSSSNAQILITESTLHRMNDAAREGEDYIDFNNPKSYIGSPFGFPEFQKGGIFTRDSLLIGNIVLRYNAVNNVIEIKDNLTEPVDSIKYMGKSVDLYAKIGNSKFVFIPLDGNIEEGTFFEVIYEGSQVDLYKKHEKEIRPKTKASTSFSKDLPPVFRDKPIYFLVTKRKKFYQFPDSRNAKFKVFGSKSEEIKRYAKKERLDVNEEKDLINVVTYFEQQ